MLHQQSHNLKEHIRAGSRWHQSKDLKEQKKIKSGFN